MIRKATVRAFDPTTYTATVQLDGSLATYLTAVPVSRAIPVAELTAGRTAAVLFFDPNNPDDAMVTGVW
jgi:hypothetical protein